MLVRSCTCDPVVALQRPRELAVADVDRDHLARRRARSRTSVKPPVEAPASRHRLPVDAEPVGGERLERAGELVPAARDVVDRRRVLAHDDRHVGRHAGRGLGRRRARTRSPGRRRPARSRARASGPGRVGRAPGRVEVVEGARSVQAPCSPSGVGSGWASRARRSCSWARSKTATCSLTGVSATAATVGEDPVDGRDAGRRSGRRVASGQPAPWPRAYSAPSRRTGPGGVVSPTSAGVPVASRCRQHAVADHPPPVGVAALPADRRAGRPSTARSTR